MIVIADASPLITLATCNSLEILNVLFSDVVVSNIVFSEVSRPSKPFSKNLISFLENRIEPVSIDNSRFKTKSLDAGEISSFELYEKLSADLLLIDERKGRKIAKENHFNIIGSLGVLIQAKRKGLIPQLKPKIEILRSSRIHFNDSLLDEALKIVGEL